MPRTFLIRRKESGGKYSAKHPTHKKPTECDATRPCAQDPSRAWEGESGVIKARSQCIEINNHRRQERNPEKTREENEEQDDAEGKRQSKEKSEKQRQKVQGMQKEEQKKQQQQQQQQQQQEQNQKQQQPATQQHKQPEMQQKQQQQQQQQHLHKHNEKEIVDSRKIVLHAGDVRMPRSWNRRRQTVVGCRDWQQHATRKSFDSGTLRASFRADEHQERLGHPAANDNRNGFFRRGNVTVVCHRRSPSPQRHHHWPRTARDRHEDHVSRRCVVTMDADDNKRRRLDASVDVPRCRMKPHDFYELKRLRGERYGSYCQGRRRCSSGEEDAGYICDIRSRHPSMHIVHPAQQKDNIEPEVTQRIPDVKEDNYEDDFRQKMEITSQIACETSSEMPSRGRLLANLLERKRVAELNDAFARLRHMIPMYGNEDRNLSKIKTLRYAIMYISQLAFILQGLSRCDDERTGKGDWKQGKMENDPLLSKCRQHLVEREVVGIDPRR